MTTRVQPVVTGSIDEVRLAVRAARNRGRRIGCVPTMGALHSGHVSLMCECRKRSDFVVVTVFVNPTQFAPNEDLDQYPRTAENDLVTCADEGIDLVFMPQISTLYPRDFESWVTVEKLSTVLEGARRPGHFRGVTTIVMKLFNIVQPDVACFGAKDYQQQTIIRRMVRDLDIPIEIVVCPTVREPDGLALSSRNTYLTQADRRSALSLSQCLHLARERLRGGETRIAAVREEMLSHLRSFPNVTPDYVVIADPETLQPLERPQQEMVALVAATVGSTRLIDNMQITLK